MTDQPGYDYGAVLHLLGGVLLAILIVLLYFFKTQDVWPFTICFMLIFPLRELYQHDWNPKRLLKPSIALEAFPAPVIILIADIVGRFHFGAA
jgi:hypothetical protein